METAGIVSAFTKQCRTFIQEGKYSLPEISLQETDWNAMYAQYNSAICNHVTDILDRYMKRVVKSVAKSNKELKQSLKAVIHQCVEDDLKRCLPL